MSELRWNPLLRTFTMVAANRQNRPHMPKDWCPFCPGSGKVPEAYDVHVYPNDFPVLSQNPAEIENSKIESLYQIEEAYGKCEVILYSPEHTAKIYELSLEHIEKLVSLWRERFIEFKKDKKIKYVFPFENRGEEVGVTMPHPHGQLYGYSFVPLKIKTEIDSCLDHYQQKGSNLFEDMNLQEKEDGSRLIFENENFMAYLPYFTDYPYGVFIVSKTDACTFEDFSSNEIRDLAEILKNITGGFDLIYDRPFPYMMCIHQAPVNCPEYSDAKKWFRFHIEFYPPLRDKNKIKWYASSEMGAWAAANVVAVEDSAKILRGAVFKFLEKK